MLSFDGAIWLVVWEDWRSGRDVYGARVSQAGTVLDPTGIPISTGANDEESPVVSFGGTSFLVVWMDERNGLDYVTYGARVSRAGIVLDPLGIAISTAASEQWEPAVSFDGTNFLVVWEDQRSGYDIYGARVSQAGAVLDPAGIPVSTSASWQGSPAVSFDGTNYLVVWKDSRSNFYDIYGVRVTTSGTLLDEFPVVTQEREQGSPVAVRGSGEAMFLVYFGWAGQVQGKRYDADRIWGKLGPFPGVEEPEPPTANSRRPTATVIRGTLFLPVSGFSLYPSLFDLSGREVARLHPGPNDVSRLSSGVYFALQEPSAVTKVVIP